MTPKIKSYGPLLIVIAALLWAVDGVLRRSLFVLPPSIIVFYEHLLGALIIMPFTVAALRREKVAKREWITLVCISLLSGVVGTLLFTAALVKVSFISISVVFLLQKLQPIFALTAAAILLKEKITLRYGGWALLAIVAAYFVTFPGGGVNLSTGSGTIMAALLATGAALAWGSSTALSRKTLLSISETLATGLRFSITAPLALILVLVLGNGKALGQLQTEHIFTLLAIALTTGMIAIWIYYRGLRVTQVKIATILELIFPVTAIIIDVFYYHTVLATSQYVAAAVLLFASYRIALLNQVKDEI